MPTSLENNRETDHHNKDNEWVSDAKMLVLRCQDANDDSVILHLNKMEKYIIDKQAAAAAATLSFYLFVSVIVALCHYFNVSRSPYSPANGVAYCVAVITWQ